MAHRLHRTATYLLVALGLVHVALASALYDELTPNTVWFVEAGLALLASMSFVLPRSGAASVPYRRRS